jgi:imidazolonepropionase-like amidohydrolase
VVGNVRNHDVAIRAGGLFDGEKWRSGPILVVAREGRVVAVNTSGESAPENCELVDFGNEASIMPGLIDAHSHLSLDPDRPMQQQMVDDSDDQVQHALATNARRALFSGITTIRDLGDRRFSTVVYNSGRTSRCSNDSPLVIASGPRSHGPAGIAGSWGELFGTILDWAKW